MLNIKLFLFECKRASFQFLKDCVDALVSTVGKIELFFKEGKTFKRPAKEKSQRAPVNQFCVFPEIRQRPSFSEKRLSTHYSFDKVNQFLGGN